MQRPVSANKLIAIVCFLIVVVCFVVSSVAMLYSPSFMIFFMILFAMEYFLMIYCVHAEREAGTEDEKADR